MRIACLAAAALVLTAGAAPAAEKIDNPEFAMWTKHKKGTSITLKTTSSAGDVTSEATMTTTLLEVGADKIVVETSAVSKFNGMEFKTPPTKRDVAKTIELPEGTKKEDFQGTKPKGTYEEGTETVKVGGTEYKTKWYKYKFELADAKTDTKMWTCDDVPGTLVKMEMTTTAGKTTSTSKTELVEFKKP
jgi:hypothetical protein